MTKLWLTVDGVVMENYCDLEIGFAMTESDDTIITEGFKLKITGAHNKLERQLELDQLKKIRDDINLMVERCEIKEKLKC